MNGPLCYFRPVYRGALLALLLLSACAAPNKAANPQAHPNAPAVSPPACSASPAASNEPSPSEASSAGRSVSPAPSSSISVHAGITRVLTPQDEPDSLKVGIEFFNDTSSPCQVTAYELHWPGGTKSSGPRHFRLPAHQSRTRFLRVHPTDGRLDSLARTTADVSVEFSCDDTAKQGS